MRRKLTSVMTLIVLIGMLSSALEVQKVKAIAIIYIKADGSVEGTDKIQRDGDVYTFSDNIYNSTVVVERDNIAIDGAGYILQGTGAHNSKAFHLSGRSNVTIRNMTITAFHYGIDLSYSSGNTISGNNITNNMCSLGLCFSSNHNSVYENNITMSNDYAVFITESLNNSIIGNNIRVSSFYGIVLQSSSNNSITGNYITENVWFGIVFTTSSKYNIISENNVTNNTHSGIMLDDSLNNKVSGNDITDNAYGIYLEDSSNHNNISENNITNNGVGIGFSGSSNNSVSGNNISNSSHGLYLSGSSGNIVFGNNITVNNDNAVWLNCSSNNAVNGNKITGNKDAIMLGESSNNIISENKVTENSGVAIGLWGSSNNFIYHNDFVNSPLQTYTENSMNIWDDGYPSGGNYWSDYNGLDLFSGPYQNITGSDGIGDTSYVINGNNQDNYPFTAPISVFDTSVWNGTSCKVHVVSNSTVSDFQLNETEKIISFNVTGEAGLGFCRVTIPNVIVHDLWQSNYSVLLNDELWSFRNWTDSTNTYIHFTYQHTEHEVTIVPEFPSILILPSFMIATLLLVILYRRKTPCA